jgi:hypothetical protein
VPEHFGSVADEAFAYSTKGVTSLVEFARLRPPRRSRGAQAAILDFALGDESVLLSGCLGSLKINQEKTKKPKMMCGRR